MKWLQRNSNLKTVTDIVCNNTQMEKSELINDRTSYHYENLDEAATLFVSHIKRGSKIGFICDYDTDGVTCGAENSFATKFLRIDSATVIIPSRYLDGYGLKPRQVDLLRGFGLIVTCDNGIAANEAIDLAKERGMDVIILDHHQPRVDEKQNIILPKADVIVDPHVSKDLFEELCGSGITYLFWLKVIEHCNFLTDKQKWYFGAIMNSFAAIGTVGDVVSLTGHNRRIVKDGIANINKGYCTSGLKAILEAAGSTKIDSSGIAFLLSPIINAAGRLEKTVDNKVCGSSWIKNILCYNETIIDTQTKVNAQIAIDLNNERKEITSESLERAEKFVKEDENFIVVVDDKVLSGIAGLVSGKLTEEYHRPSIVLSQTSDPDILKGSGRSVEGTNLKEILDKNNQWIEQYGGHPLACGITLSKKKLDNFCKGVNACTPEPSPKPSLQYDLIAPQNVKELWSILKEIEELQPYGQDNPEIIFAMENVKITAPPFKMGQEGQHLKLTADGFDIVWFNGSDSYEFMGSPTTINIIGSLTINCYKGEENIQFLVKDMEPA